MAQQVGEEHPVLGARETSTERDVLGRHAHDERHAEAVPPDGGAGPWSLGRDLLAGGQVDRRVLVVAGQVTLAELPRRDLAERVVHLELVGEVVRRGARTSPRGADLGGLDRIHVAVRSRRQDVAHRTARVVRRAVGARGRDGQQGCQGERTHAQEGSAPASSQPAGQEGTTHGGSGGFGPRAAVAPWFADHFAGGAPIPATAARRFSGRHHPCRGWSRSATRRDLVDDRVAQDGAGEGQRVDGLALGALPGRPTGVGG